MANGHFIVLGYPRAAPKTEVDGGGPPRTPPATPKPYDIQFQLAGGEPPGIPPDQAALKARVERFLYFLRKSYRKSDPVFRDYFDNLLALSQVGLVGNTADPEHALQTLTSLEERFYYSKATDLRATFIWTNIGYGAMFSGAVLLALALLNGMQPFGGVIAAQLAAIMPKLGTLAAALVFVVLGQILYSFLSSRANSFTDLMALQNQAIRPGLRLFLAQVLLVILALFLKLGVFDLKVGSISLANYHTDWKIAAVLGIVVGMSFEALAARTWQITEKSAEPAK